MSALDDPYIVSDIVISSVLLALLSFLLARRVRRASVWTFYGIIDVAFTVFAVLGLSFSAAACIGIFIIGSVLIISINSGIIRSYVAEPITSHKSLIQGTDGYDKEKLIKNVCAAVEWLSSHKVGALMTFERQTDMNDIMHNGTVINCPFTPEIVETIFYEGTRLHDGAIIVRGDTIIAAAVYYSPSTKVVMGKMGARHRAALGISEITDSITVVVSEETGQIEIAHSGLMDHVENGEFEPVLRSCFMS